MTRPSLTGIGMTSARTRDRLIARLREQGIANPQVLERIRAVPRHVFVDEALASRAYEDTALPIGHGQTISQPYIVARMTEALIEGDRKIGKVLEVGTGCGYQTAVLAPLVKKIYSIERIAPLHHKWFAGGGYPPGPPTGTDIPLGARIIAVADTLAARTSRPPLIRWVWRWPGSASG